MDLRRVGSGNVGAANVYRTTGRHRDRGDGRGHGERRRGGVARRRRERGGRRRGSRGRPYLSDLASVPRRQRCGHRQRCVCRARPHPDMLAAATFALSVARTRFVSLGSIVATVVLPGVQWMIPGSARGRHRHDARRGADSVSSSRQHRAPDVANRTSVGNMTQRIGVLGSGSWGTALAVHLARTGHDVRLWARDAGLASAMTSSVRTAPTCRASRCRSDFADRDLAGRARGRGDRRDGGAVARRSRGRARGRRTPAGRRRDRQRDQGARRGHPASNVRRCCAPSCRTSARSSCSRARASRSSWRARCRRRWWPPETRRWSSSR